MTHQSKDIIAPPERAEAQDALALLRRWAAQATPEEVADLDPAIARRCQAGDATGEAESAALMPQSS